MKIEVHIDDLNIDVEHNICDKCGYDIESSTWNRKYEYNNKVYCDDCFSQLNIKTPYFINHIPSFVADGSYKIMTFTDANDLYRKLKSKYIEDDCIITQDKIENDTIILQNTKRKYWEVIGYIKNFNCNLIDFTAFDANIYDKDNDIAQEIISKTKKKDCVFKKGDKVIGKVPIIGKIEETDIIGTGECECVGNIIDIAGDFCEVHFSKKDNRNLNIDEVNLAFFKGNLKLYGN